MGWYDTYQAGVEACDSASGLVGDVTGAVYGAGAYGVTGGNVAAAAATDHIVGGFVEDHFTDT